MSNIEMIRILKQESEHGSPPAISNVKRNSYSSLSKNDASEDVEQTPTSSFPELSPIETCQVRHESLLASIWQLASVLLVPAISIAYLAFCYAVHDQVVPANVSAPSPTATTHLLTNIGSAVTTVNIIIISLSLFPLKGLLSELQSEEFFRLLSAQKNSRGVELSTVNDISNRSYGLFESIMVIVNRHCSLYYVLAFIAAAFVWAVSTLAPAALSIQPILVDGAVMAFSVGAIPPLSIYQPVAGGQTLLPTAFSTLTDPKYAAAVVWAEREIGLSYSFSVSDDSQGAYAGFVVPIPKALSSTASARWLTDVIGLNPYCTWANPVNLTAASLNVAMNSTNAPSTAVSVHLEDVDLRVSVPSSYFPTYTTSAVTMINVHDPTITVLNHTTGSLPTDGAMVVSVIQCASTNCTKEAINIISLFVNFTDVPSMDFSTVGADYKLGFLVCKPNITIETREIRTQGSMTLEVQPHATGAPLHQRQGNLDWTQTSLLVSYSLSALTTDSGPASSGWLGLGSGTQVDFLFGSDQMNSVPSGAVYENTSMVLKPLSTDQLAKGYTELVKASMKPYVSGALGTSYVPGRVASVEQIFVSSLPHVIASTISVFFLLMIAVVAHFRRGKGYHFNLTNVAAALAESELPQIVKSAKVDLGTVERRSRCCSLWPVANNVGQEVARKLGNWKISLAHPDSDKTDGGETLHISRERQSALRRD